jgi:hypothetical protein
MLLVFRYCLFTRSKLHVCSCLYLHCIMHVVWFCSTHVRCDIDSSDDSNKKKLTFEIDYLSSNRWMNDIFPLTVLGFLNETERLNDCILLFGFWWVIYSVLGFWYRIWYIVDCIVVNCVIDLWTQVYNRVII